MARQEIPTGRSAWFIVKNLAIALMFAAFGAFKWTLGAPFASVVLLLFAALMAWYAFRPSAGKCPDCGKALDFDAGEDGFIRCGACGTYVEFEHSRLWSVPEETVAPRPVFEAPVPAGPAQWPDGCCVCGQRAARTEALSLNEKGVSRLLEGAPHCADHRKGVALVSADGRPSLRFRSFAYREAFKTLNPA